MASSRNFREDAKKIDYVKSALLGHDRFQFPCRLDDDLNAALEWIADRDADQACTSLVIFGRVLICWFWCLFQAAAERGLTMRVIL